MATELHDTICAVATPVGEGGIGILRISGEKALDAASPLLRLRSGHPLAALQSHRLYYADILRPALQPSSPGLLHGEVRAKETKTGTLDEALVVVMRAPHSYTGETVVEIHCHGSPLVLHLLSEAVVQAGARLADPGEFTKRAFLNGRLDLAQAEAVLDTIRAKTASSLTLAQEQLRGTLSTEVNSFRESLLRLLAHVEAAIDFTEEDITFIQAEELESTIRQTKAKITALAESSREGRILREGVMTVIVGRPNVGKSSLLNALLRTDRAIVTAVPGTTRDVLEEVLNMRGVPLRLLDTAGLRHTNDHVEQEGVRRSRSAMEQADLLLIVFDGSLPICEEDRRLLNEYPEKKRLVVINKSDLPCVMDASDLASSLEDACPSPVVRISARHGQGLDELRDVIRTLLLRADFEATEGPVVTHLRHQTALLRARESLAGAEHSVTKGLSGEFVAMDLRGAVDALGEITGAVSTDDILDRIFRDFCIGK